MRPNATTPVYRSRAWAPSSLLGAAFGVAGLALAPSAAAADDDWKSPLRAGAWAAEFRIERDFDYGFGAATTAIISMKRCSSDRTAFRWSIGFDVGESKEEGTGEDSGGTGPVDRGSVDRHREESGVTTGVQWMRYQPVDGRLSVFAALGPGFRYTRSSYRELMDRTNRYSLYESIRLTRSVGLYGTLGFEWFFSRRLSLGAGVGASGEYVWGRSGFTERYVDFVSPFYNSIYQRNFRVEEARFRSSGSSLMLTAYF